MADTTRRILLWLIGTVTGIIVIGLIGLFGSYSELGSSLYIKRKSFGIPCFLCLIQGGRTHRVLHNNEYFFV